MKIEFARVIVALWCGWVIVQAPYVGEVGLKSDASRPIHEWNMAIFGNRTAFFDTVNECEEKAKALIARPSTCAPVDWFRPHRWWQFWK